MPKKSRLQTELKKKGAFASREQEVLLSLARTFDQLSIRLERLIQSHGLTGSQYNVLRILRGEGTPLPMNEIASRTVQVHPGITGLVDRLEVAGLVNRERSAEDRRVIIISITDRALAVLAELDLPLPVLEKKLLDVLSRDEQREMIRLLEKIRSRLEVLDAGEDIQGVEAPTKRSRTTVRKARALVRSQKH
jgi:DNA-binding MarR family transcriptional regulator